MHSNPKRFYEVMQETEPLAARNLRVDIPYIHSYFRGEKNGAECSQKSFILGKRFLLCALLICKLKNLYLRTRY